MLDKIKTILEADASVAAAVGTKVFYEDAPQGTALPYIILSKDGGTPNDTKDGDSQLDQDIVQVACIAELMYTESGIDGAYTLMDLCRTALDHHDGTVFARALNTPQTLNLSKPNKPFFQTDMDFEVYNTR